MEFDEFLTQPKWQILELIAKKPTSPVKISEQINTSVAYVSQQLKLLEAASIIKKYRTKESSKGKPRLIYSIYEDVFYITALINETPIKKKISPSVRQKAVLKIWTIENKNLSYVSEKLFWRLESNFDKIQEILVDENKSKIIIVADNKSIDSTISSLANEFANVSLEVVKNSPKKKENLFSIYSASLNDTEESQ